MMKFFSSLLLVLLVTSCALNNRSRKNIATSEIVLKGGIYQGKSWDENFRMKRISWYDEASMQYDVLISEIDKDSQFAKWLGRDYYYLDQCAKFYVTALYSDLDLGEGITYLASKLEKAGLDKRSIQDFSENFKAHQNFADWKLYNYKLYGFCRKPVEGESGSEDIVVSIPGFKTKTL
ncbi:MAG: hypothetical protein CME62_10525 [Halobacteriovoraceae bacterium]|nr:hypothetical protein [Halobacteriovoraceae bacterium]